MALLYNVFQIHNVRILTPHGYVTRNCWQMIYFLISKTEHALSSRGHRRGFCSMAFTSNKPSSGSVDPEEGLLLSESHKIPKRM